MNDLPCRVRRFRVSCVRTRADSLRPSKTRSAIRRKIFDKDILRVGDWNVDGQVWHVTRSTLRRLVHNWRLATGQGVQIPVVWNHSRDARDQIGSITHLYLLGNTLHARFWAVDPEDVRKLGVTVNEVSVEVREPWWDGFGNCYDIMLTHLAVVNHPVVSGQEPFRKLRSSFKGTIRMNEKAKLTQERSLAQHLHQDTDPKRMDLEQVIADINELLLTAGSNQFLPNDTTLENFTERLSALVEEVLAQPTENVASLRLQLNQASAELEAERQKIRDKSQSDFTSRLDRLIGEGRIAPADKPAIVEAADRTDYSLSLLAPFERIPVGSAVPTEPIARGKANGAAPAIGGHPCMTPERAKKISKTYRQ